MTVLDDLRADLVERRLWPVAAALVAGSVAIPVAFAPSGSATPAAPPAVAAGPAASDGTTGQASDAPSPGPVAGVPVSRKDPFVDADAPKAPTDGAPVAGLGGPAAVPGKLVDVVDDAKSTVAARPAGDSAPQGSAPSAPGAGDAGAQADPGGSTQLQAAPDPDPSRTVAHTPAESPTRVGAGARVPDRQPWSAELRLGSGSLRHVRAMTPLPSADDPAVVYLGMLPHGRRAVLLLRDDVTARGQGTCRPRPDFCQTLELEPGQHARLTVSGSGRKLTLRYRGALAPQGGALAAAAKAAGHGRAAKPKLVSALTSGRTYWLDASGGTLAVSGRVGPKAAARARRRVAAVGAVGAVGARGFVPGTTSLWALPTGSR